MQASSGTDIRLPDWLSRQAEVRGAALALATPAGRWSYRVLYEQARVMAGTLAGFGVVPGDRVALLAKRPHWVALTVHGVCQRGAVLVPVNWRLTPVEIAWQLQDAEVSLLVCDQPLAGLARQVVAELPEPVPLWNLDESAPTGPPLGQTHVRLEQPLAMMYTSGTTGHPKGVLLTYGNFWWSALASALQLGVLPTDQWLVPLPLFHVGGLSVLLRSLIYGTAAVAHEGFDSEVVNAALDSGTIQLVSVVPTMLQRMLAGRQHPYPASLRCVLLGGSYAPRPLLEQCQALRVPVAQSYGLTEAASQVCTLLPEDGLRKLGSSGKPLLPTEVRIDVGGRAAAPGEVGEIWVRGPTVTPGYWRRPEATAQALSDGWLHTGDLGYLDAEGYLFVLDRRADLIVSGGENIYPAEIENALAAYPGVAEAAVVGAPDPEWGQVPVAFMVPVPGWSGSTQEVMSFLAGRLARYKLPKRILTVPELPRNASGKLLRRALRAWLQQQT
ncbi:MAG: o-succinylbenzoate--CoA ligase [Thermoflavifilum sp.]|nr:o-succinylbenzoate--CoA ligase [Thermoflavifilum sp.]MCL6514191.1 o-succinylbenzoate--CoA ligase [Alicyclobacillus sp.]